MVFVELSSASLLLCLCFQRSARLIPIQRLSSEVRFVRHVTSDSRMVAEHRILGYRFARLHRLKECIQVRTHIVPVMSVVRDFFVNRFLAQRRSMLGMPLFNVFLAHP